MAGVGLPIRYPRRHAIVALCMAVERAEFQPEPVEILGWL